MQRPEVSVIAPALNERGNLGRLLSEIAEALSDTSFEVIVVDDASGDGSQRLLEELSFSDHRLRPHFLTKRCGQSGALLKGLELARGHVVVTMDADLQNPPSEIPRLLEHLAEVDMVCGRRERRADSLPRRLASRVANRIRSRFLGDPFTDIGCSLRAYRAWTLAAVPLFDGVHRFLPLFALAAGATFVEIPVEHRPRVSGDSKYGALRGRLGRGIWDLVGVRWLLSKRIDFDDARVSRLQEDRVRAGLIGTWEEGH